MASPAKHGNILVIMVDQHRADCLGCMGNREVQTPHIDALAAVGVRYENSFCPFPVCTPSRYSFLSGRYAFEHRGLNNRSTPLPEVVMWPELLRRAGYRTAAVGKMHFTPTYLDVGFERMCLSEQDGPGRWDDDYHRYLRDRGLVDADDLIDQRMEYREHAPESYWKSLGAKPSNLPEEHHSTTWIGDRAVEELETWQGNGNLLMASFIKPHHPHDPPKAWWDRYPAASVSPLPGWMPRCPERDLAFNGGYFPHEHFDEAALRQATAAYYANIAHVDHQVGRMVEKLKEKGLYEDTLILYTADHGEYMGFHHMTLKAGIMYDPLVKVPLVIRFGADLDRGGVSEQLVSNIDIGPTLLAWAGVAADAAMTGRDLYRDEAGHAVVFAEDGRPWHAMARDERWKLVRQAPGTTPLLFDLQDDPLELHNVYEVSRHRAVVERLEAAIDAWRGEAPREGVYVDHDAPVIDQPNVPKAGDGHREAMIAYCREAMSAYGPY